MLVWSNQRVIRWIQSIGLGEYANRLTASGIHGSIFALDASFDSDSLALYMQIPTHNFQVSYF